jgi:hypothetical protein
MTQTTNLTTQPINSVSLSKKMLIGAGIALILICIFLYGVKNPESEWGKFWMVRPLIIVPFAGAMGGLCYYFINYWSNPSGWKKTLAIILSLLVYVIGLWMGFVLGLDGTLWD